MKLSKLKENSLLSSIFYMGFGTIIAQMINVLIQPVLTRIVPAETLGIYTFVVSLASIVIPVASLKLEMLVVSEKDDTEAQFITDICVWINLLVTFVFFIIILVGYNISGFTTFSKYGAIVFLTPLLVLTNGIRFIFISYNNRYKKYKLITGVAITREFIRAVIQVISGLLTLGVVGQVMGYALSPAAGLYLQTKDYFAKKRRRLRLTFGKAKEIIIQKGGKQIIYLVPSQFINSFSNSFVTISITTLFSATVLGYYSASVRLLEIPIMFITSNVNKVCYQRFCENVSNRTPLTKTLFYLIAVLSVISFSGFGLLFFIAPQFSEIVFGQGYYIAGVYIKHLCLMYAIRLVATSFNGVFTIFGKQKYELGLNIALIIVAAIAYALVSYFGLDIEDYLNIICIGYTVVYSILLVEYCIICKKYDRSLVNTQ